VGPSGAMPTDPLECFIQELWDLSSMNGDNGPDISAALDKLPVQQRREVGSISMQEAVEVYCLTLYIICYIICNNGCICPGWILAASMETRQYRFHQEQEHPDGLPKTEDDECAGYQRSHIGRVSQQRFPP
jgi:hypothetical protein